MLLQNHMRRDEEKNHGIWTLEGQRLQSYLLEWCWWLHRNEPTSLRESLNEEEPEEGFWN